MSDINSNVTLSGADGTNLDEIDFSDQCKVFIGGRPGSDVTLSVDSESNIFFSPNDSKSASIENATGTQRVACLTSQVSVVGQANFDSAYPFLLSGVAGAVKRVLSINAAGVMVWGENDFQPSRIESPNGLYFVQVYDTGAIVLQGAPQFAANIWSVNAVAGTAEQAVRVNAAGSAMEWYTPETSKIESPNGQFFVQCADDGGITSYGTMKFSNFPWTMATVAGQPYQYIRVNSTQTAMVWGDVDIDVIKPTGGTALQYMRINAAGASMEWASLPAFAYTAGTNIIIDEPTRTIATTNTPVFTSVEATTHVWTTPSTAQLVIGSDAGNEQILYADASGVIQWIDIPNFDYTAAAGKNILVDGGARTIAVVDAPVFSGALSANSLSATTGVDAVTVTASGNVASPSLHLTGATPNILLSGAFGSASQIIAVDATGTFLEYITNTATSVGAGVNINVTTPNTVNLDDIVELNGINLVPDGETAPILKEGGAAPTGTAYLRSAATSATATLAQPWNELSQTGAVYDFNYSTSFLNMLGENLNSRPDAPSMCAVGQLIPASSFNDLGAFPQVYGIAFKQPNATLEFTQKIRFYGDMWAANPLGLNFYVGLTATGTPLVLNIYIHSPGLVDIVRVPFTANITFIRLSTTATNRASFDCQNGLEIDLYYTGDTAKLYGDIHVYGLSTTTGDVASWISGGALVVNTAMNGTA